MPETNENKSLTGTSLRLKVGLAEMLKGGVIMDVMNVEQARIAEEAGAVSVMAIERVPAMIRAEGGGGPHGPARPDRAAYSHVRARGLGNGWPYQPSTTWGPDTPRPSTKRPPERWSKGQRCHGHGGRCKRRELAQ